jgi:hypothetical protein
MWRIVSSRPPNGIGRGRRGIEMHHEFTAVIEQDGEWYIGYCPEIPGANGQGRTIEECKQSLAGAVSLILLFETIRV